MRSHASGRFARHLDFDKSTWLAIDVATDLTGTLFRYSPEIDSLSGTAHAVWCQKTGGLAPYRQN